MLTQIDKNNKYSILMTSIYTVMIIILEGMGGWLQVFFLLSSTPTPLLREKRVLRFLLITLRSENFFDNHSTKLPNSSENFAK